MSLTLSSGGFYSGFQSRANQIEDEDDDEDDITGRSATGWKVGESEHSHFGSRANRFQIDYEDEEEQPLTPALSPSDGEREEEKTDVRPSTLSPRYCSTK